MTHSRLTNKFLKTKSRNVNRLTTKKEIFVLQWFEKVKKNCFNNLNVRNITDNKQL